MKPVEFTSEFNDYVRFTDRLIELRPEMRPAQWPARIGLAGAMVTAMHFVVSDPLWLRWGCMVGGAAWMFFHFPRVQRRSMRRNLRKWVEGADPASHHCRVELDEHAVSWISNGAVVTIPWASVVHVEVRGGAVEFVHGDRQLSMIPLRAFDDDAAATAFRDAAEAHRLADADADLHAGSS